MRLKLELPATVALGDLVVGRVRVINDGGTTISVPVRLHLHEGDIAMTVDADRHVGAELVDSVGRFVDLPPGHSVASGVSLVASDRGSFFQTVGTHTLAATYSPAAQPAVRSNEVTVEVVGTEPRYGADQAVALSRGQIEEGEITTDDNVATRVVVLASAVRAEGFSDMTTEQASEQLRAELSALPVDEVAWLATALVPPAPMDNDPLLAAASLVIADDEVGQAILAGKPFLTQPSSEEE